MNELKELIEKASKQLGFYIEVSCFSDGRWSLKHAYSGYAIDCGTFEACIAKLKEWARPPKPDTMTIANIPTAHIEWYARNGSNPVFSNLCKEALKPYEVQS